ncbi:hypothetical protein [Teredinibacter purpureus]|uniref:hypothetical protein n=1 Tax=Teredinibacter purpureus TaxID=2731756 RepID=UPI0013C4D302|nr:hypothetical protein [Teredinibacter purpureus]
MINFDEFTVIDWWISQYQISREHSAVETSIPSKRWGIDHLNLGPHTLTVHKIELNRRLH